MGRKIIPSHIPFHPGRVGLFYGWIILPAGIIGMLVSIPGQTMGVSVFTDYLVRDLSISRVQLSIAYLLGTLVSGMLITGAGIMYDRFGSRLTAMVAGFMLGTMLLFMTRIDRIAAWLNSTAGIKHPDVALFVLLSFGFLGIRFFGQGMLTMISRNMVMKWFDRNRGRANAVLGIFTSFGFSLAPQVLDGIINLNGWKGAWEVLGVVSATVFVIFAFFIFRDSPEDAGLIPDGKVLPPRTSKFQSTPSRSYGLKEATSTYSFWVFNLSLSMIALSFTAVTFHVVSVFESAGFDRQTAVSFFLPTSLVAVSCHFIGSWLSDYIRLKYILYFGLLGMIIAMAGLLLLGLPGGKWMLIAGNGMANGTYSILMAITWPRFFGLKNLGRISGLALSSAVIGSAFGPLIYSLSARLSGSYHMAAIIIMVLSTVLLFMSFRANNVNDGKPAATAGDGSSE